MGKLGCQEGYSSLNVYEGKKLILGGVLLKTCYACPPVPAADTLTTNAVLRRTSGCLAGCFNCAECTQTLFCFHNQYAVYSCRQGSLMTGWSHLLVMKAFKSKGLYLLLHLLTEQLLHHYSTLTSPMVSSFPKKLFLVALKLWCCSEWDSFIKAIWLLTETANMGFKMFLSKKA